MNQINILFVDIDGTLTTTKSGKPFKQAPDDIKPLLGAQKAITHFANRGYKIFGVSNQGGCDTIDKKTGERLKRISDTIAEVQNTITLFPQIDSILFSPNMDGLSVWCVDHNREAHVLSKIPRYTFRKPDIGMVLKVLDVTFFEQFGKSAILESPDLSTLDLCFTRSLSLFVGDRDEDRQCAANAGIPFMDADMWRFEYGSFV